MKKLIILSMGLSLSWSVQAATLDSVLLHYSDLAYAMYSDSLLTAKQMQKKIDTLIDEPTEQNLDASRTAWRAARVPYMQTEAYRFGNEIVDDWEGKVNSWPLDEGLIDYTAGSYGDERRRRCQGCHGRW